MFKKFFLCLIIFSLISGLVGAYTFNPERLFASSPPYSVCDSICYSPVSTIQGQVENLVSKKISSYTAVVGGGGGGGGGGSYGGVLKWLTPRAPGTPIGWPAESQIVSTFSMQLCLQTLLKEQLDGSLTPCLATSYVFNSNPADPSITFYLRHGVKFHDGTDFNAQAVKWNFDQVINGGQFPGITNYWESIEVIDDYTLRVNLTTWSNRFIRAFIDFPTYIVSPAAYNKNGIDWMRWNMVGTGPFIQVNFQKDVFLFAAKNPNYWEAGKPYLDGVHLMYIADETTRIALFKSGGADVMDCGFNTKAASELAAAGYHIFTSQAGPLTLAPDSLNAYSPWSYIKVRQAAEYGIDKAALSKAFGYGYTSPAYQVFNQSSMAYDPALPGRKYDPAKAKQLLTEAGYPNGFKTRIIAPNGRNQNEIVAIQAYLAKIGIQADLQFVEPIQFTQIVKGTWDNALICVPLVQSSNPNVCFNSFFGVPPSLLQSLKKPDGWSALLNTSLASPAPDPALTRICEDALYNDATVIPLFFQAPSFATANNVRETYLGSRGRTDLWEPQLAWLGPDAPLGLYPGDVGPIGIGPTFNLDIKTNVGGTQQVSGVDAFINFDPSRLEVVDADAVQAGIQINPGASLDTVLNNNVDNTSGLINYCAGKLGSPFPSGSFTVATIQFRAKTVTSTVTTPVTISLSGNSTTSIVDFGGTPIPGTHGDASVQIVPGASVTFNVVLQGGSRPDSGWIVPLTVKLFTPGATTPVDVLTATPVCTFNLTTAKSGSMATALAIGVAPGTYDISVVSPHCLTNVERGVVIAIPSTTINLGTLLEGNANDDDKINIQDFGVLAISYGKSVGISGYDARADFDRNGIINIADFGLLAVNYARTSPVELYH